MESVVVFVSTDGTAAPMSTHADHPSTVLKASYVSPSGSTDFQHVIAKPASRAVGAEAKTEYLRDLRASSRKLQDEINKFLTDKMEEDKQAQSRASNGGTLLQTTQEELEEENYGEEVAEDDA
ncbi:hypothetical protein LTS17_010451 [Exophiala oligosperma]